MEVVFERIPRIGQVILGHTTRVVSTSIGRSKTEVQAGVKAIINLGDASHLEIQVATVCKISRRQFDAVGWSKSSSRTQS